MNICRKSLSLLGSVRLTPSSSKLVPTFLRNFCDVTHRPPYEKSLNQVVLMGRVGIDPQLRGSEDKSVAVFTLATNINYRYDSGDYVQKTDWHRITVFKPHLRDIVIEHLKKGSRVYIEGRILYGEFTDAKGNAHQTTSIVANDVIFLGAKKGEEHEIVEEKESI